MTKKEKAEVLRKIGALLRKRREAVAPKLSATKVAKRVGVTVQYISDVEQGRRSTGAERLRQIADAISMSEAERYELFVTAKMIPPAVQERLSRAPHTWDYDPAKLLAVARDVKRHIPNMPKDLASKLDRALQKAEW